jgi:hypothetical protein
MARERPGRGWRFFGAKPGNFLANGQFLPKEAGGIWVGNFMKIQFSFPKKTSILESRNYQGVPGISRNHKEDLYAHH